jgi:hypothetical protein
VKKILKYSVRLYKRVDIAPLDSSNLSFKIAIFLLWGINVLFFLTKDIIAHEIDKNPSYKYKASTLTVKLSPITLSDDIDIEFYAPKTGVISSYDVHLIFYELERLDRERSPPSDLI